jgi:hypothetical protein
MLIRRICLVFALLVWLFCSQPIWAQESCWLRYTTHISKDSPLGGCQALTLPSLTLQEPFALALFEAIHRKNLKVYRDESLTKPYTWRGLCEEAYYLELLLSNSGKKSLEGIAQLPDYSIDIYLPIDSADAGFFQMQDRLKPLSPPYYYYFRPEDFYRLPLEKLRLLKDYNYATPEPIGQLFRCQKVTSTKVCRDVFGQLNEVKEACAPIASVEVPRSVDYGWAIPRQSSPKYWNRLADSTAAGNLKENEAFFQRAVPSLWRAILLGKIPLYQALTHKRLKPETLFDNLREHSQKPPEPTLLNLRTFDYSFGIEALEVDGMMEILATETTFQPKTLAFVWGDAERPQAEENVGYVRMSDINKLKLRYEDKPISQWLEARKYYSYALNLNDAYPDRLEEALVLDAVLKLRMSESLYAQRHFQTILPELRRMVVQKLTPSH